MTLETLAPFKIRLEGRNRDLCPGTIITIADHLGWKILGKVPNKVRQVDGGPCFTCRSTRRWLSVYGAVICGTCHPPADPSLVVRWVRVVVPTIQQGDSIQWQRVGILQHGTVDFIHVDPDGGTWAFVTLGGTWAVLNLKFVKGERGQIG